MDSISIIKVVPGGPIGCETLSHIDVGKFTGPTVGFQKDVYAADEPVC